MSLHSKVVITTTLILILSGFIAFYFLEYTNENTLGSLTPTGKILASFFQAVTPRTCGFNTLSLADLRMPSKLVTIILMFIGASPGSTGGGIKTSTFALIIMMTYGLITSKEDVEIYQKRVPSDNIFKAVVIAVISIMLVLITFFILTITENANFIELLFETISAFEP